MSKGAQTFTQSKVTRALRGAVKAGFKVRRVEIDASGNIVLDFDSTKKSDASPVNPGEWDNI